MQEPEFDKDGYPSEETESAIENWPIGDWSGLLEFVQKAWSYPTYVRRDGHAWRFATGGWSGNEDLISAMQRNHVFWAVCWMKSERGGAFEFEAKPMANR